jgi:hypothetical protein
MSFATLERYCRQLLRPLLCFFAVIALFSCFIFPMSSNSLTCNLMVQDGCLLHHLDREQNVPGPVWCKTGLGRET